MLGQLKTPVPLPSKPTIPIDKPEQPDKPTDYSYTLNGKIIPARNASAVMVNILNELSSRDPSFIERFVSRKHGKKRRYVARTREELYPGRPDLAEYSKQLSSGWWIGTNYSKSNIRQIIQLACEVAGLRFGHDLNINL